MSLDVQHGSKLTKLNALRCGVVLMAAGLVSPALAQSGAAPAPAASPAPAAPTAAARHGFDQ